MEPNNDKEKRHYKPHGEHPIRQNGFPKITFFQKSNSTEMKEKKKVKEKQKAEKSDGEGRGRGEGNRKEKDKINKTMLRSRLEPIGCLE